MVSTLTWVLVGVVAYTVVAMALRAQGLLPDAVRVSGPITTLHTKRGRIFLDKLARPRRVWRALGNFGVGVALVVMVGFGLLVAVSVRSILLRPELQPIDRPQDYLVIPGVNRFLPLSAAPDIVAGLLIGMVVHEGAHGLLCRVEDIEIESMGLALFTLIPVGAFVAPDEESQAAADRGGRTRMFAAGVTANFAVTLVVFVLLFGPLIGSIGVVEGVPVGDVIPGSAAAAAGLSHGDVIESVGGTPVANVSEFRGQLDAHDNATVAVGLQGGETIRMERSLTVTRALPGAVEGISLGNGDPPTIRRVNDTQVATERAFRRAVSERTVAAIGTDSGTAIVPVGAYANEVIAGEPLAEAGAPAGEPVIVTRIGDQRIVDTEAMTEALESRTPGATVAVEAFVGGERDVYEVELADRDGEAFLGVAGGQAGYTTLVLTDAGVDPYPAEQFLSNLGKDSSLAGLLDGSFFVFLFAAMLLPFASIAPGFNYNFPGFTGEIANFYVLDGPLAFLGAGVFTLANVCFWTGWINFNLAIFNCLPTYPLDGGHILRSSVEAIVARLPVPAKARVTTAITVAVSLTMLAGLALMVFGPGLLG